MQCTQKAIKISRIYMILYMLENNIIPIFQLAFFPLQDGKKIINSWVAAVSVGRSQVMASRSAPPSEAG